MPRTVSENYVCQVRKPVDFDEFWGGVLDQASRVSLDVEIVPEPLRSSDEIEVFQVFYTSLDHVRVAA